MAQMRCALGVRGLDICELGRGAVIAIACGEGFWFLKAFVLSAVHVSVWKHIHETCCNIVMNFQTNSFWLYNLLPFCWQIRCFPSDLDKACVRVLETEHLVSGLGTSVFLHVCVKTGPVARKSILEKGVLL